MEFLARMTIGLYVSLLALFVILLSVAFVTQEANTWLGAAVLAAYAFAGLIILFPFAYYAAKYIEAHKD